MSDLIKYNLLVVGIYWLWFDLHFKAARLIHRWGYDIQWHLIWSRLLMSSYKTYKSEQQKVKQAQNYFNRQELFALYLKSWGSHWFSNENNLPEVCFDMGILGLTRSLSALTKPSGFCPHHSAKTTRLKGLIDLLVSKVDGHFFLSYFSGPLLDLLLLLPPFFSWNSLLPRLWGVLYALVFLCISLSFLCVTLYLVFRINTWTVVDLLGLFQNVENHKCEIRGSIFSLRLKKKGCISISLGTNPKKYFVFMPLLSCLEIIKVEG